MKKWKIPFNKPFIIGNELSNIQEAVNSGHLAGDGIYTAKCSAWMEKRFQASKVLLTDSCTSALEMAAILCGISEGDEVILPSFTFVSTANAFLSRGAQLKFIDIRPDTLNLDESLIEDAINEKTRVVVPVHYGGVGCEMDTICAIAEKYNLTVVEDAAQGVNARYRQKYLGTIGHLGTFSFHGTKNFICGEGGALLVNEPALSERAEIIREKGTNRSKFFRGEVDKYTWIDVGSSYLPSELTAAFLYAQLQEADTIDRRRQKIRDLYRSGIRDLAKEGLIEIPHVPEECRSNAHMFCVLLNSGKERNSFIEFLASRGIHAVFHYLPLHSSPMGRKICGDLRLPVTESVSDRLVRLPCFYELTDSQVETVLSQVHAYFGKEFNGAGC